MSFGSSLLNDLMKLQSAITEQRPVNQIIEQTLIPASIAPPTPVAVATKLSNKRKEMRTARKPPSEDIKALLQTEPLTKRDVELYFLNKLLRLITADEES